MQSRNAAGDGIFIDFGSSAGGHRKWMAKRLDAYAHLSYLLLRAVGSGDPPAFTPSLPERWPDG